MVAGAVRLGDARPDGAALVWAEGRPDDGGRTQLVRRGPDGTTADLLPAGADARSAVHEYGGGAWWVQRGVVWWVDWGDQRIRRLDPGTPGGPDPEPGGRVTVLTPEPDRARADRYADGDVDPSGRWIACVRERHADPDEPSTVLNELVRVRADAPAPVEVLRSGPDFVAAPRWSPDGRWLCWVEWDHPDMPWDHTRLMVRRVDSGEGASGAGDRVAADRVVAGRALPGQLATGFDGGAASEPAWAPDGSLTFVADRDGWWNVWRWVPPAPGGDGSAGLPAPLVVLDADVGAPQWSLGLSRHAVLTSGPGPVTTVVARWRDGLDGVAAAAEGSAPVDLDIGCNSVTTLRAVGPATVVVVGGGPTEEAAVRLVTLHGSEPPTVEVVRPARPSGLEPAGISPPEPITFPSAAGRVAHGLFFAPASATHQGPPHALPPLVVMVHGGPTGAARPELSLGRHFWTSRGFAVVEVNHAGSTGFGRAFREALRGGWGVVDVEDCLAAVEHLAATGRVDPGRCVIRGGSAGGFTVLRALSVPGNPFAAGADHYGVADLEALAVDTHKFELRYLDGLVGPLPGARDRYRERSPVHHIDALSRPMVVLQGLQDRIVPPAQSEAVVAALRAKGVPTAYVTFPDEQHGFRRAENQRRALEAELSFYAAVLGFALPPHEAIARVELVPPLPAPSP